MKTRWIVALVIALVGLFAILANRQPAADFNGSAAISNPAPTDRMRAPEASVPGVAPVAVNPREAQSSITPDVKGAPATVSPAVQIPPPTPPADSPAPIPAATTTELRDEIENIQFALRDYRSALGENPVGNNAEITKALTGNNPKQVKIPVPPGSSVNAEGEMCDRWGTPYFFHQLSGKQMEIRSAGPDRELNTSDDLVVK